MAAVVNYDPNTSINEGIAQQNALTDMERKTAAYNVLANTYGLAVAGDPDTALKAQEYAQRQQTNPIAVQKAQADLTAATQQNDFAAQANPLKIVGLGLTNQNTAAQTAETQQRTTASQQLLPGQLALQRAQAANEYASAGHTNAETQLTRLQTGNLQGQNDAAGAMGILGALSDVASNGGDVGAAFDQYAPAIAKMENVDPSMLPALRAKLVQDPVNTINQLASAVQASNLQRAGGTGKVGATIPLIKFSQGQMSMANGLRFIQQRTNNVPNIISQMQALLPYMASNPTIAAAKALIPSSPEHQFELLAHSLNANASLDDLRTAAQQGLHMGRVSNMEMGLASSALGNTGIDVAKPQLAANLAQLKKVYGDVNANLAEQIKQMGNGGTPTIPGVPHATAPQSKTSDGWSITVVK